MKRIFSLLIVVAILLTLTACDTGSKKEIVGDWLSFGPTRFVFNADGTGTYYIYEVEKKLTWKYDKDLSVYVVATNGQNVNATIKTDGETKYLSCAGTKHYAPEIFAQMIPARLEQAQKEMAQTVCGTKMELGQEYTGGSIAVKFDLEISDGVMWLCADVRNDGTAPITTADLGSEAFPLYAGYKLSYFDGSDWMKSVGGFDLSPEFTDGRQAIEPGSSGTIRLKLFKRGQMLFDRYGAVLGYVTCSVGTAAEDFYIDFSDYTPN